MARVQISRSAETDLLEGYVFYERQQAGVGDYILDSLYADIDALKGDIAIVVAVLDCRQDPDSITERLAAAP